MSSARGATGRTSRIDYDQRPFWNKKNAGRPRGPHGQVNRGVAGKAKSVWIKARADCPR